MALMKNVLGLDLGAHSLKAVEFSQNLRGFDAVQLRSLPRTDPDASLENMLREGRGQGLAVILATQSAADIPQYVHDNAATQICFRHQDRGAAEVAANRLGAGSELAGHITHLADGEAFVRLGKGEPQRLRTVQYRYDWERWEQSKDLTAPRDS